MRSTRTLDRLGSHVILIDTVGFVSDLPTQLVAAFQSTLEEILYADVIIHVRDVSSENFEYALFSAPFPPNVIILGRCIA